MRINSQVHPKFSMSGQSLDIGSKTPLELLDPFEVFVVVGIDKVDNNSSGSKSASPADAMKVSLPLLWKVVVDDQVDPFDIDSPSE